jgi:hypothetical protein
MSQLPPPSNAFFGAPAPVVRAGVSPVGCFCDNLQALVRDDAWLAAWAGTLLANCYQISTAPAARLATPINAALLGRDAAVRDRLGAAPQWPLLHSEQTCQTDG